MAATEAEVHVTELTSPSTARGGFALDIGGTCAKIIYQKQIDGDGKFYMVSFSNKDIHKAIDYIKLNCSEYDGKSIWATGMGSHRFRQILEDSLNIKIQFQVDEFQCNVSGLLHVLSVLPGEAAIVTDGEPGNVPQPVLQLPGVMVTFGTGISAVHIKEDGSQSFAFGSNRGGATFEGLGNLLIPGKTYDDLVDLAEHGDKSAVSLTMQDVANGPLGGLPAHLVTAYFGKASVNNNTDGKTFKPEDVAHSLLGMISFDFMALVFDYVRRHQIGRIYVCGNFVRRKFVRETLRATLKFISRGTQDVVFPQFGGYIGALGAYLLHSEGSHAQQNDDVFWAKSR